MIWKILSRNKFTYFFLIYFLIIFVWWLKIFFSGKTEGLENFWFNIVYGWIALIGSINGLIIAYKRWGGHRSVIGKGLIFLSMGLFGEWFGNAMWGYYNVITQVEIPYPSLADLGFFSIIPLYAVAILYFARAAGIKLSLKTFRGQLQAITIPLGMLAVSWALFLKDIPFDTTNLLKLFLDYGYPAGEAITVSIAILAYSLSRKVLGGKMRGRILYIIFALVVQYITDYSFLYSAGVGTYYNAGVVDLMYASSLTIMSLGLLAFKDLK